MNRDDYLSHLKFGNDFDKSIALGTWRSYRDAPVRGEVVIDIGAHIGTYSVYAALAGARRVYAFEPLPRNLDLLRRNTLQFPNIKVYSNAIRSVDCSMWLHSAAACGRGHNWGHNTVEVFDRQDESIEIKCVALGRVLEYLEPGIIKTDCEGSEFDFLKDYEFPQSVRWFFGEIHFHKKEWREAWPSIKEGLKDQGFKIFRGKESIINGSSKLHGLVGWKR